jgi:hypothetical protein
MCRKVADGPNGIECICQVRREGLAIEHFLDLIVQITFLDPGLLHQYLL